MQKSTSQTCPNKYNLFLGSFNLETIELEIFFLFRNWVPVATKKKKKLVEFWKLVITSYNHHSTFFPIDPKISCCKRIFGVLDD